MSVRKLDIKLDADLIGATKKILDYYLPNRITYVNVKAIDCIAEHKETIYKQLGKGQNKEQRLTYIVQCFLEHEGIL